MIDSTLRSLERLAQDDPSAAERLITERIRAGGRDPRVDPRAGDSVSSRISDMHEIETRTVERVDRASASETLYVSGPSGRLERRTATGWRRWARTGRVLVVAPEEHAPSECYRGPISEPDSERPACGAE